MKKKSRYFLKWFKEEEEVLLQNILGLWQFEIMYENGLKRIIGEI